MGDFQRLKEGAPALLAVLALSMTGVIGLGLSRFAYALVLPDMRADLGWGYSDAGLMNSMNAAGYLLSALLTASFARRIGEFPTVILGAWICVAGIALTALSRDYGVILLARFLAGFGGAFAFVAGGVLAVALAQRQGQGSAFLVTLFYIGPGLGVIASGAIVPPSLEALGPGSWPKVWLLLALASAIAATVLLSARRLASSPAAPAGSGAPFRPRQILLLLASYFCFGFGYIAYMTFMIAFVRDAGGGAGQQAIFWMLLGLSSIAAPFLWSSLFNRASGGRPLAMLNAVTMTGSLLPLISTAPVTLYLSALLFGCAFLQVVAGITIYIRRNLPAGHWTAAIGLATVCFGIGQTIGPFGTGALTDLTGELSSALAASAVMLGLAALIALRLKDFPRGVADAP